MGPNFCIPTTPTFLKEVVNILQESGRVPHNALNIIFSLGPVYEFVCVSFTTGNLNCFRVK